MDAKEWDLISADELKEMKEKELNACRELLSKKGYTKLKINVDDPDMNYVKDIDAMLLDDDMVQVIDHHKVMVNPSGSYIGTVTLERFMSFYPESY